MSFHNPTVFCWLFLAIPIVVSHFFGRRERRDVGAQVVWQATFARRTFWSKWRRPISLLVQLSLIALTVTAAARPYWGHGHSIVFMIDTSASMSATDVKPSRFVQLRQSAKQLLDSCNSADEVAVFSVGSVVRVHCGFSRDRARVRRAMLDVLPTDGPTRILEGVELARRSLKGKPNPLLLVLTDGCFDGAAKLAAAQDVRMVLFGDGGDNVGITRCELRQRLDQPGEHELFVEVGCYRDRPVEFDLEITTPGEAPHIVPIRLESQKHHNFIRDLNIKRSGIVSIRLLCDDDLASDNVAELLVHAPELQQVELVAPKDPAIKAALEALAFVHVTVVDEPSGQPSDRTITIFHGDVPSTLPSGPVMVIEPATSGASWELDGEIINADALVVNVENNSALLSNVDFKDYVVGEAVRLIQLEQHTPLVWSSSGDPLYSLREANGRRVLVLHTRLAQSDLARRTTFPILLSNAIRWLSGEAPVQTPATGNVVVTPVSSFATKIISPGRYAKAAAIDRALPVAIDQHGLWQVTRRSDGEIMSVFPSNIVSARESNLRRAGDMVGGDSTLPRASGCELWFFFACAALMLAIGEWILIQKRVLV